MNVIDLNLYKIDKSAFQEKDYRKYTFIKWWTLWVEKKIVCIDMIVSLIL